MLHLQLSCFTQNSVPKMTLQNPILRGATPSRHTYEYVGMSRHIGIRTLYYSHELARTLYYSHKLSIDLGNWYTSRHTYEHIGMSCRNTKSLLFSRTFYYSHEPSITSTNFLLTSTIGIRRVWIPNLGALPIIASVSLTHIPCLSAVSMSLYPRRCKTSSVGQSAGLSIARSSVRLQQKLQKPRSQIYMDLSYIDSQARILNYCFT